MYRNSLHLIIAPAILFVCLEAQAAPATKVKGKLDNSTYSILGLDEEGKGRSPTSTSSGSFSIQSTARSSATFTLLSSDGEYAGPVVLGIRAGNGKLYSFQSAKAKDICSAVGAKAVTGLKFPAKKSKTSTGTLSLGVVKVDSENEFAYITKKLTKGDLVLSATSSVDENCVPEGAGGKLGLSSAAPSTLAARIRASAQDDTDSDGAKNSSDLDDDNDGISDSFDLDSDDDGIQDYNQPQANDAGGGVGEEIDYFVYLFTNFQLEFTKAYNMHSMTVSQELIDSRVKEFAGIAMGIIGNSEFEVEIDGHGLPYFSSGGSGRLSQGPGGSSAQAFPDEFDPDGDGMGRIDQIPSLVGGFDVQLKPNATTSQIKAGDVASQVFVVNGKEVRRPMMLEFLFHTTPTLTSIKLGENATSATSVSYPIQDGAPGTGQNCFSYNATTLGHKLTFTVERPQRPGITEAGEAAFMDMGNLRYVISANAISGGTSPVGFCPVSAFSSSDSNLSLYDDFGDGGEDGVLDSKGDVAFVEGQSNALTFTLDLQACTGQSTGSYNLTIKARTPRNDNSGQGFCMTRQ